jgi:probable FeS assembly SUF system protein SufT
MPSDTVILTRDCSATEVPFGGTHLLPAGTRVHITQSLGGSYTITSEQGQMLRIEAKDADALGFAPQTQPQGASSTFSEKLVWDQLKTVYDPEIPVNIVDLGLIYACDIKAGDGGHAIDIKMSMTAPGCGMGDVLKADIERKLAQVPDVKHVNVEIVFDPPWDPSRMSEAAKLQLGLDLDYSPAPSALPIVRR